MASRIAFLTVGVWWIGFAQIPFSRLPDTARPDKKTGQQTGNYLLNGFRELRHVWAELQQQALTKRFLVAFFVYNMAVQTVMYVATIFGSDELKMPGQSLIITILLIQLVAIPGAYGFSRLSERIGNTYALMVAVVIWIGICAGAYFVQTESQFFGLAAVVGLVMGGIQSLSRSTYSKLIPATTTDTASYFSFYDVTEKMSIVLGHAGVRPDRTTHRQHAQQRAGTVGPVYHRARFVVAHSLAKSLRTAFGRNRSFVNLRSPEGVSDGSFQTRKRLLTLSGEQRRLAQLVQSAALTEQRSAVRARYFLYLESRNPIYRL